MEEEHSMINNDDSLAEPRPITLLSNSHRLPIRRGILRQTTASRSLPYNSTLSYLRRRQTLSVISQDSSNLINNANNPSAQSNINASLINHDELGTSIPEVELIDTNILVTSEDENDNDNVEVLVDLSHASSIDLMVTTENNYLNQEQDHSYNTLSTFDFYPDNEDEDEDDDQHQDHFYYRSSASIHAADYSSSSLSLPSPSPSTRTAAPPMISDSNGVVLLQHEYDDEHSSQNNSSSNTRQDLNIEIIFETPQNHSLTTSSRRRRSVISSNTRRSQGLRSSDILCIPQKLYGSLKEEIYDDYQQPTRINTQCYICLEDFVFIDSIKILNCQHIFHSVCITEWLHSHSTCAYCRIPVLIDMFQSSSATIRRRQRTRGRQNSNVVIRNSTSHSRQQVFIESSTFEQQQS